MTKIHTYIYIVKQPDSSGVKNNKRQLSTLVKECGKHGLIDDHSQSIHKSRAAWKHGPHQPFHQGGKCLPHLRIGKPKSVPKKELEL